MWISCLTNVRKDPGYGTEKCALRVDSCGICTFCELDAINAYVLVWRMLVGMKKEGGYWWWHGVKYKADWRVWNTGLEL